MKRPEHCRELAGFDGATDRELGTVNRRLSARGRNSIKIRRFLVAATAAIGAVGALSVPIAGADLLEGPPQPGGAAQGVRSMTVNWIAPTSGTPLSYTVKVQAIGDVSPTIFTNATSPYVISTVGGAPLKNGGTYQITICAEYQATGQVRPHTTGTEVCTNPFAGFTLPLPQAPINVAATAGDRSAVVTWSVPQNFAVRHGAVISHPAIATSFRVTAQPGGKTCTDTLALNQPRVPQPQCTLTGLTNGVNYAATVVTTDRVGSSPASTATNFIPYSRPLAATGLGATPTTTTLAVHWNPAGNNGRAVWQYKVTATPGAHSCTTGFIPADRRAHYANVATTCTLSGLTPNTTYRLSLVASNLAGMGAAATVSAKTLSTAGSFTVGPFVNGKGTLTPELEAKVKAAAQKVHTLGITSITIVGYTDASGSAASNIELSLMRANAVAAAVKAELKALGHANVTVTAIGAGATNFIGGNPNDPNDRRVVISWK